MTKKMSDYGLNCLKRWEGCRLEAYQDQSGIWTIGYGITNDSEHDFIRQGLTIDAKQAHLMLINKLQSYEKAVNLFVLTSLTQHQFDALVSFCFNIGITAFKQSSLLRKLNQGDYDSVPQELMKWNRISIKGKKIISQGLINRRAAEAGLWVKGSFVASRTLRPNPAKEHPLLKPETLGPLIGSISGLTGFATIPGPVQWSFALIMLTSCFIGSWYVIRRIKKENA